MPNCRGKGREGGGGGENSVRTNQIFHHLFHLKCVISENLRTKKDSPHLFTNLHLLRPPSPTIRHAKDYREVRQGVHKNVKSQRQKQYDET